MQLGDDQTADVVQERGDRELVAVRPADRAADLVGGVLGGEGVDAEALGAQLPAAVGLEEVEDRRGAGDRQHAGGLQHVDGLGIAADAAGGGAAAVGEAQHGDREADVRLDRLDQLADAGGLRGGRLHHPRAGLDQDRESLDRLEGRREAGTGRGLPPPRARRACLPLAPCRCSVLASHAWPLLRLPHRHQRTHGLAAAPHFRDQSAYPCPLRKAPAGSVVRQGRRRAIAASIRASDSSLPEHGQRLEDARARPSCR